MKKHNYTYLMKTEKKKKCKESIYIVSKTNINLEKVSVQDVEVKRKVMLAKTKQTFTET